jgi:hypothetical protein
MSDQRSEAYHSYLLRVWREDIHEEVVWRASLHCVQNSVWTPFATLPDLFAYLLTQTELESLADQGRNAK